MRVVSEACDGRPPWCRKCDQDIVVWRERCLGWKAPQVAPGCARRARDRNVLVLTACEYAGLDYNCFLGGAGVWGGGGAGG